jgi:hypothetical protein
VYVVNARHYKNVPGRKSDVSDCQWLQYLHSVGLLRGSFRPAQEVCALRTLLRHREGLVQAAAEHVQHMQKALDQMNLQLHHVISDITGLTGLAILDAILDGERDPHRLAQMRNGRIRASEEVIAKALEGDYRSEHLFTLGQSLAAYRYYQELMRQCDSEIQQRLKEFDSKIDVQQHPLPPSSKSRRERLHGFHFRAQQYRIFGVDLTQVPSLNTQTVQVIWRRWGRTFRDSAAGAPLPVGCRSVRTTRSAEAGCCRQEPEESKIEPLWLCGWRRSRCTTTAPPWVPFTGARGPNWAPRKPSPPLPTSSLALSIIW